MKEALLKKRILRISCGSYHTGVLTDTGEIYCWGLNDYGQCGDGTSNTIYSPYHVRGQLQNRRMIDIKCGGRHTLAAEAYKPLIFVSDSTIRSEMKNYLNNAEFSDFILRFPDSNGQTKNIFAHRIFLARCTKFRALFDSSPQLQEYEVGDVSFPIFKALLEFLYFDNLNEKSIPSHNKEKFAQDLLQASHIYGANLFEENLEFKLQVGMHLVPLRSYIPQSLSSDLKNYINNPALCDVRFNVEGKTIHAHKVILGARSPHFKAMFTSQFKESFANVIEIPEISASLFLALLEFIYTDSILTIKEGK